ncbi:MAG TPA: hypothetical protein VN622_09225 [Clostridia bacterium]|nr:hypothetical protein [Clostridia bacterium]
MLRAIVAVVVGYLIFAVAAVTLFAALGRDPHGAAAPAFMIGSTLYGMIFAGVGGFAAVAIARTLRVAYALTGIIALGAVVSMFGSNASGQNWSQLAALLLMAPMASVCGALRVRSAAHASN